MLHVFPPVKSTHESTKCKFLVLFVVILSVVVPLSTRVESPVLPTIIFS